MKFSLIHFWHKWLGMPKFDKVWHENDIRDELAEYSEEKKLIKKWSELSDVAYTYTRSKWSGHEIPFPLPRPLLYVGLPYMYLKYTSRFLFYARAGKLAGADKKIRCVRNPKKLYKLDSIIAEQNINVDKDRFIKACQAQAKYWPLVP